MDNVVDAVFIRSAIENDVWDLGNSVLYDLCKKHPRHKRENEIAAKIWLIGRSYAAAIERRRIKDTTGDNFFYEEVIPKILQSNIDDWISEANAEPDDIDKIALATHKKVQNLFFDISKLHKRSLASKYLHFHLPNKFFIFDTRAVNALRKLISGFRPTEHEKSSDKTYADFVQRCRKLNSFLSSEYGQALTPRDFDKVLLAYSETQKT